MAEVYCPQCQAIAVNGTPVHERGCPNVHKKWVFRGRKTAKVCIPKGEDIPSWLKD